MNDQPHDFLKFTRGIKQGDSLSPTCFILAEKSLLGELNALNRRTNFKEVRFSKWSEQIDHLAYADDYFICVSRQKGYQVDDINVEKVCASCYSIKNKKHNSI